MEYKVITFIGDYTVDDQPLWDAIFTDLARAKAAARGQNELIKMNKPILHAYIYTVVCDTSGDNEECYFIVYSEGEEHDPKLATELADSLGEMIVP